MGVNSLPKTVTRQRCDCDLNPDPSVPESSTLTTRLPSHSGRERNDIDMYSVMQTFQPTDPCATCRRVLLLLLLLLFIRIKRRGSSPAIEYGLYLYLLYAWVVNFLGIRAAVVGYENVPRIIANVTINLFLKTAIGVLLISKVR